MQGSREPLRHTFIWATGEAVMRSVVLTGLKNLKDADYSRRRAVQTRGLSRQMLQPGIRKTLLDLARDYDELADDLANRAIEVRHPELMPGRVR